MRYLTGGDLSQFDLEEAVAWEQLRGFGVDEQAYGSSSGGAAATDRWTSEDEGGRGYTPGQPTVVIPRPKPVVAPVPVSTGYDIRPLEPPKPLVTKAPTPAPRPVTPLPNCQALLAQKCALAAQAQLAPTVQARLALLNAASDITVQMKGCDPRLIASCPKAAPVAAPVAAKPAPIARPLPAPPTVTVTSPAPVVAAPVPAPVPAPAPAPAPTTVVAEPSLEPLKKQLEQQVTALKQEVAIAARTGESVPTTERNIRILENKIRSIDVRGKQGGIAPIQKIKETLSSMAQDGLVHSVDTLYGFASLSENARLAGMAQTSLSKEERGELFLIEAFKNLEQTGADRVKSALLSGVDRLRDAPAVQASKVWANLRAMQVSKPAQQDIAGIVAKQGEAAVPVDKFEEYAEWKIGQIVSDVYRPQFEALGKSIFMAANNVADPNVDKQSALNDLFSGVDRLALAVGQNSKVVYKQLFITDPMFRGKNIAYKAQQIDVKLTQPLKKKVGEVIEGGEAELKSAVEAGVQAAQDLRAWWGRR